MIVLVSDTPVAGTVERLAKWIEKITKIETKALIYRNYPHHAFPISHGTFGFMEDWKSYVGRVCREASCIIFHNVVNNELIDVVLVNSPESSSKLYQIHSPPFEGPQFTYEILDEYKFDNLLKISQGHGRFFDNGILVPNVVEDIPQNKFLRRTNNILIPHIRITENRWSSKVTASDINNLKLLPRPYKAVTIKSLFNRDTVAHSEVVLALQTSKAVIDDINSGLIHQTAIEGLKAGCLVFSGADLETMEQFTSTIDAPIPPFEFVSDSLEILEKTPELMSDSYLSYRVSEIQNYTTEFLSEKRLAEIYVNKISQYIY
ncbi:hypothetical protein [Vibrio porteresiae]|uniref:Glycosyltransferase n=1 Tax=Vibrio porteresiae DSM 19223 TaxID=1123496 RepID=A0ABZ0QCZ5_9VIBR|nr:hypothetical protein [Vibrio porteresiae]WPC74284.1 hypothetical protein R8Z52_03195 [Vibrio porteresiae DSM 19223]